MFPVDSSTKCCAAMVIMLAVSCSLFGLFWILLQSLQFSFGRLQILSACEKLSPWIRAIPAIF